jgi:lambda family phage portal protein
MAGTYKSADDADTERRLPVRAIARGPACVNWRRLETERRALHPPSLQRQRRAGVMNYQVSTRVRFGEMSMTASGLGPRQETFPHAYRASGIQEQETYAYRPPFTSGESATLYDRNLSSIRADDMVRNDPVATAGVMRIVDMLVGACLRLTPQPNARALGLDPADEMQAQQLTDLAHAIKSEWDLISDDHMRLADAQRRLSINGIWRRAARTFTRRGEACGYLDWKPARGRYATCVRQIDPDRVSNPMGQPDTTLLRGGIEYDRDGVPLAAQVRNGHPADWFRYAQLLKWTRIPFFTDEGRPVFIHAFEADREDQSRAVTPFASLLTQLRMVTKHGDVELANAAANAIFTAFVHSNLPVADATAAFTPQGMTFATERIKYLDKNPVYLNGVRIPVLAIGDEVKMNNAPRQTAAFDSFQAVFLRKIASALGISYEQLVMDWTKTNYSSARAALNEVWRSIQRLFAVFVEQYVTPVYYGFLDEMFDRGYVVAPPGAPNFEELPAAYLGARWLGPGRGYVDPVKEAEAASLRIASGTSTLEKECGEQGSDWLENLDQLAREQAEKAKRKLVFAVGAPGSVQEDPSDRPEQGRDARPAAQAA